MKRTKPRGRKQDVVDTPIGRGHEVRALDNRVDGRLTPVQNHAVQIALATWALRELKAQRQRQSFRAKPQTS